MNNVESHKSFTEYLKNVLGDLSLTNDEFDAEYVQKVSLSRKNHFMSLMENQDVTEVLDMLKETHVLPTRHEIRSKVVYKSSSDDVEPRVAAVVVPIAAGAWVYVAAATQVAIAVAYWVVAGVSVKVAGPKNAGTVSNTIYRSEAFCPGMQKLLEDIALSSNLEFAKKVDRAVIKYVNTTIREIAITNKKLPFFLKNELATD